MAQPIHESIISTYRLRKDLLEDYLKTRFAGFGKEYFNVHVSLAGRSVVAHRGTVWCDRQVRGVADVSRC